MLSSIPNALYAQLMNRNENVASQAMSRLSSGTQLNHSWENPGRFSMAENIHRQAVAASDVTAVIQDAINIVRIGEDGVGGILDTIQNLRETVVQAANGVNTPENQAILQDKLDTQKGLLLQAFSAAKNFRVRLDGPTAFDRILHFQVGTNAGEVQSIDYNPLRDALRAVITDAFGYEELYNSPDGRGFLEGLGVAPPPAPTDPLPPFPIPGVPVMPPGSTWADAFPKKLLVAPNTQTNISASFTLLDTAREAITAQVAYLGNCTNRLEAHLQAMQSFEVDMGQSESSLRDTDMAKESTTLTRAQVLQQASQAMLAQANSRSLQVLDLLRQ